MQRRAPVVLNAASEAAVAAFLAGKLSFLGICAVVEEALAKLGSEKASSLEEVLALDKSAELGRRARKT